MTCRIIPEDEKTLPMIEERVDTERNIVVVMTAPIPNMIPLENDQVAKIGYLIELKAHNNGIDIIKRIVKKMILESTA